MHPLLAFLMHILSLHMLKPIFLVTALSPACTILPTALPHTKMSLYLRRQQVDMSGAQHFAACTGRLRLLLRTLSTSSRFMEWISGSNWRPRCVVLRVTGLHEILQRRQLHSMEVELSQLLIELIDTSQLIISHTLYQPTLAWLIIQVWVVTGEERPEDGGELWKILCYNDAHEGKRSKRQPATVEWW